MLSSKKILLIMSKIKNIFIFFIENDICIEKKH